MRFEQKFSFKILFLLICTSFLTSCFSSKKLPSVNATFEKKFGGEVKKVNADRVSTAASDKVTIMQSPAEEIAKVNLAENQNYNYVEVNKFSDKQPEIYLPNGESYEQTRFTGPANSVPQDLFEISYNLGLYPAFRRVGAEFDRIAVPSQDVYGVKTEMSEKSYLLAGNNALQKSIDQINADKTSDDIDNTQIVIREQKQLRRQQRMIKTFGESGMEMALMDQEESPEDKEK